MTMQFIINKSNSPSTILSQGLADQFGYIPMQVDMIIAGPFIHRPPPSIDQNITPKLIGMQRIDYMESTSILGANHNGLPGLMKRHRFSVLLIELWDYYKTDVPHDKAFIDLIARNHGVEAKTIIDTTGKYPQYIRDKGFRAIHHSGEAEGGRFNQDINTWMKLARYHPCHD